MAKSLSGYCIVCLHILLIFLVYEKIPINFVVCSEFQSKQSLMRELYTSTFVTFLYLTVEYSATCHDDHLERDHSYGDHVAAIGSAFLIFFIYLKFHFPPITTGADLYY